MIATALPPAGNGIYDAGVDTLLDTGGDIVCDQLEETQGWSKSNGPLISGSSPQVWGDDIEIQDDAQSFELSTACTDSTWPTQTGAAVERASRASRILELKKEKPRLENTLISWA
ncbi:MAG: hypothetical protein AAF219_05235 [Myxococcota bacterium]